MGQYKAPRKLNFISFIVGVALLGGIYSGIRFGPIHYRKWQAKSVLSEAAAKAHSQRVFTPNIENRQEKLEKIVEWSEDRLRKLGIADANLAVTISDKGDSISAMAQYTVLVKHPIVNKTTTLYFRPNSVVTKAGGFD